MILVEYLTFVLNFIGGMIQKHLKKNWGEGGGLFWKFLFERVEGDILKIPYILYTYISSLLEH